MFCLDGMNSSGGIRKCRLSAKLSWDLTWIIVPIFKWSFPLHVTKCFVSQWISRIQMGFHNWSTDLYVSS